MTATVTACACASASDSSSPSSMSVTSSPEAVDSSFSSCSGSSSEPSPLFDSGADPSNLSFWESSRSSLPSSDSPLSFDSSCNSPSSLSSDSLDRNLPCRRNHLRRPRSSEYRMSTTNLLPSALEFLRRLPPLSSCTVQMANPQNKPAIRVSRRQDLL
jgi:hypothetical protein